MLSHQKVSSMNCSPWMTAPDPTTTCNQRDRFFRVRSLTKYGHDHIWLMISPGIPHNITDITDQIWLFPQLAMKWQYPIPLFNCSCYLWWAVFWEWTQPCVFKKKIKAFFKCLECLHYRLISCFVFLCEWVIRYTMYLGYKSDMNYGENLALFLRCCAQGAT